VNLATRVTEGVVLRQIRKLPIDSFIEIGEDACLEISGSSGITLPPRRAWTSARFTVQEFDDDDRIRLSIQRARANCYIREHKRDLSPISWDELQWVKSAVGYSKSFAVEIFPPDEAVVNVAWMRHLWIVDPSEVPWAWSRG